jgi:uncharacterized protein
MMMGTSVRDYNLPLVAATTLATILITTQIKPIARPVKTFLSRLYLRCCVVTGRSSTDPQNESSNTTVVTALYTYPVKSLRAVPCDAAVLDSKGFVGDRRFMLVTPAPLPLWGKFGPDDATHRFMTQRQCPSLARVVASFKDDKLTLSSDILPNERCTIPTEVATDAAAKIYKSTLWGDIVSVQDMGDEAARFLQRIVAADTEVPDELKQEVRLVVQYIKDTRTANDKFVPAAARTLTGKNPSVAFADGFPMYVILLLCFYMRLR